MAEETEQQKSEQSAFAKLMVGATLNSAGAVFLATLSFLASQILPLMPFWLAAIIATSAVVALPFFGLVLVRLGGCSPGSEHRDWYTSFRFGFLTDNYNGRYAMGVGRTIYAIDKFFGDAEDLGEVEGAKPKPLGLFPKAFGLKLPAPLWTAASYDRCLLVAVVYPMAALFIFWTIWGGAGVGQAELALGMKVEPEDWKRATGFAALVAATFAYARSIEAEGWRSNLIWFGALCGPIYFSSLFIGGAAIAGAVAGAYAATVTGAVAVTALGAGGLSIAGAYPFAGALGAFAVGATFSVAMVSAVSSLTDMSKDKGLFGPFMVLLSLLFLVITLWAPGYAGVPGVTTLLYFFGLLTIVNAPFDWVALGVTRGLLRRGQQSGGLAPIIAALVDLVFSLVLMAILAFAILWATEIYNHSAIWGGNDPVIDVSGYLAAIADPQQRGDPQYYWLYAMLFSSQIPAIANFAFSALCLLRGAPVINRKIAQMLPESGDIGTWQRLGVASLASVQLAVAVAIGLVLYYALLVGVIAGLNPVFGGSLVSVLEHAQITPLLGQS